MVSKILEFKNVNFSYDDNQVLNNLNFFIEENSYNLLVGKNGSGKSSIAKLIVGLENKENGEIIIFDKQIDEKNIAVIRKNVGMIFQNPDNQFIANTVKDDIIFGLENHNIDPTSMDELVDDIANKIGIKDLLNKEPSSLSGGQKQKIAIASVLVLNPKIIILDEASSMLDPVARREFRELIKKISKENNVTIISITHDMSECFYADNILLLDEGNIVYSGAKDGFFRLNLKKYNLELPKMIELEKKLGYKNFIYDEEKFMNELVGKDNE